MSYRHSSYRKMGRAALKANAQVAAGGEPQLTRTEVNRIMHWSGLAGLPKPKGWGKPKAKR